MNGMTVPGALDSSLWAAGADENVTRFLASVERPGAWLYRPLTSADVERGDELWSEHVVARAEAHFGIPGGELAHPDLSGWLSTVEGRTQLLRIEPLPAVFPDLMGRAWSDAEHWLGVVAHAPEEAFAVGCAILTDWSRDNRVACLESLWVARNRETDVSLPPTRRAALMTGLMARAFHAAASHGYMGVTACVPDGRLRETLVSGGDFTPLQAAGEERTTRLRQEGGEL